MPEMRRSNPPHLRPLEQFLAALGLTVIPVLDFDPMRRRFLRYSIPRFLPLGNDAFEIQFARFVEEFCDLNHKMAVTATLCFLIFVT